MSHRKAKIQHGFTLLEILLVVAAIAILAGIVILAINPSKQLADTRNAQRRIDVNTILNAIYQYAIDNSGDLPVGINSSEICDDSSAANQICKTTGTPDCTGISNLSPLTTNEKYLVDLPQDPSGGVGNANGTGYFVTKNSNNRVTVCSPEAENAVISVTR